MMIRCTSRCRSIWESRIPFENWVAWGNWELQHCARCSTTHEISIRKNNLEYTNLAIWLLIGSCELMAPNQLTNWRLSHRTQTLARNLFLAIPYRYQTSSGLTEHVNAQTTHCRSTITKVNPNVFSRFSHKFSCNWQTHIVPCCWEIISLKWTCCLLINYFVATFTFVVFVWGGGLFSYRRETNGDDGPEPSPGYLWRGRNWSINTIRCVIRDLS